MSSSTSSQQGEADRQILTVRALEEAVAVLFANNFDADSSVCLVTLIKVLDNVLHKPVDPKVRQLRLSNAAVWQKIGQRKGAIEILEACGFQKETAPPPLLSGNTAGNEASGESILILKPDRENQSIIVTARRLLQIRAVQDLKMDPNLLPPYREPPPPPSVVIENSKTNSGFNVFAGHRYDAKSAAVGANLGPSEGYVSKTEIALNALKQQQQKLEQRFHEQNPVERNWQAFEPVRNMSNEGATISSNNVGGGDSSLLMARAQQKEAERKQREEGGFTTAAMRELERLKKEKVYSHVTLTIQFPSGHSVRGQFLPKETVQTVVESLQKDCLIATSAQVANENTACIDLYVTPPRRLLGLNQTLQQEGLVPAAKVFASWKKGCGPRGNNESFLHSHLFPEKSSEPTPSFPTGEAVAKQQEQKEDGAKVAATTSTKKPAKKKGDREEDLLKRMMGGGGRR